MHVNHTIIRRNLTLKAHDMSILSHKRVNTSLASKKVICTCNIHSELHKDNTPMQLRDRALKEVMHNLVLILSIDP